MYVEERASVRAIAVAFGRTEGAIKQQIKRQGLKRGRVTGAPPSDEPARRPGRPRVDLPENVLRVAQACYIAGCEWKEIAAWFAEGYGGLRPDDKVEHPPSTYRHKVTEAGKLRPTGDDELTPDRAWSPKLVYALLCMCADDFPETLPNVGCKVVINDFADQYRVGLNDCNALLRELRYQFTRDPTEEERVTESLARQRAEMGEEAWAELMRERAHNARMFELEDIRRQAYNRTYHHTARWLHGYYEAAVQDGIHARDVFDYIRDGWPYVWSETEKYVPQIAASPFVRWYERYCAERDAEGRDFTIPPGKVSRIFWDFAFGYGPPETTEWEPEPEWIPPSDDDEMQEAVSRG